MRWLACASSWMAMPERKGSRPDQDQKVGPRRDYSIVRGTLLWPASLSTRTSSRCNRWPERDHGGMRRSSRLSLPPARSRHEVLQRFPSDHRIRSGENAPPTRPKSKLECPRRALGAIGKKGVPVNDHSLRRALLAAGNERICCALPC